MLAVEPQVIDAGHKERTADALGPRRVEDRVLRKALERVHERPVRRAQLCQPLLERTVAELGEALRVEVVQGRLDAEEWAQADPLRRPGRTRGDPFGRAAGQALPERPMRREILHAPALALAEDGSLELLGRERADARLRPRVLGLEERQGLGLRRDGGRPAHARPTRHRGQRSSPPAGGAASERSRPQTQIQPIRRAGLPTMSPCAGTSPVTTEPAPTMAYRPISMPGSTIAPAPT